ncbi:TPA: ead/Ea22-like family protein [Enterobacter roggenkampii]
MSNIDKQALRERYSENLTPKCHICGSVMTIQRAGAGSVVYGCTGRIGKDGEGYKFAEGRDFADDHYARSRVTVPDEGDPDVLALLDELEAKDRRIEEEIGRANREHHRGFMMACGHLKEHSNVHYADAAEMEIAALRNRINELESVAAGKGDAS